MVSQMAELAKQLHQLPGLVCSHAQLQPPWRHFFVVGHWQGVEPHHQMDVAQSFQHVCADLVQVFQREWFALTHLQLSGLRIPFQVRARSIRQQDQCLQGPCLQVRALLGRGQLVQLGQQSVEDYLHQLQAQGEHRRLLLALSLQLMFLGPGLCLLHEQVDAAVWPFVAEKEDVGVLLLHQLHVPVQLERQFCQL